MNYETQVAGDAPARIFGEEPRSSKRRALTIGAVIAIILIAAAAWISMHGKGEDAAATVEEAPVVTVLVPGQSIVPRTVSGTGSLAARVDMPVGVVGEGGQVTRVLVQPGDWVRAGQVLAVIERSVQTEQIRSLAAQLEVNRADAKLAQAQLDRAQALVKRGFISRADIDQRTATRDAANARVNVAVAQLAEQRARTGRLDIRAPAAGLVLTREVEPGQIVGSGSGVLFRMAKGGEMELLTQLSEGDLATLRPGNSATVTPVGSQTEFSGRVWQVSPVVDPQTRQGIARIAIPYNKEIRPGGFAAARIVSGTATAPLLPESAIQTDAKGHFVYVINGRNEAERRGVEVGQVSPKGVPVTRGLNGGERIVASAGAFLRPGQKVRPQVQKAG
ncbi:efflux RND transporter periplasmic adaptor subunit [Sphingomonadales bacterium 56]|uniref:efflux RND transporter periplasmic adaptor subunit n=1 Tax=unclassified Sphingobium TaxID=2611147 RepID=UPI00191898B4|nr:MULTISPECIES: efflux RND transporter periplasmic adaptor subunit [unclassified Sphingobium]MBY2929552.1 efflux RND transporter periplasmic adaptor subunit [Sphingomonadales bacterium 56]MBY2958606.1 efflux RND transporter periplasmic adaptor subunit [Sphingomonadales bacterium 58]CAD7337416.1 Multidrug resistance protein MdtA [Sphingobium sp. S8]CAD7339647.1 Multidrug resistance protein MdtA [Sphingobium sp. S6]